MEIPNAGTYTVILDTDTLPEGVALTNPDRTKCGNHRRQEPDEIRALPHREANTASNPPWTAPCNWASAA